MQIQGPVEWMHMGNEVLPQIRTRKPQPRRSSRPHWPVQSLYSPSSQFPAARALGTGGRFSRIIGEKTAHQSGFFHTYPYMPRTETSPAEMVSRLPL